MESSSYESGAFSSPLTIGAAAIPHCPRVLCLDGGGIRGYASLLILKRLMAEIQRKTNAEQMPLPCQYFDLICGTSTGGLIAIMLGRLKMNVDECITSYMNLSKSVFRVDNVFHGIPVGDNGYRFNEKPLEMALKDVVREKLGDENAPLGGEQSHDGEICPVFVIATDGYNADGPAKLFRSYGFHRNRCPIWQVGRATTAAPTFFKPAFVANPPEAGGVYIDGGLKHNNPSRIALQEAGDYWETVRRFCIVSIGTGRQRAVDFIGDNFQVEDPDEATEIGSLLRRFKGAVSSTILQIPGATMAKKTTRSIPNVLALKGFVEALVNMSTSAEEIHEGMLNQAGSRDPAERFPYHRFNVERGMDKIGLEEWRKMIQVDSHTKRYLEENATKKAIKACVRDLSEPAPVEFVPQSTPLQPQYFMVPYEKNEYFVGRDGLLDLMFDKLCDVKLHQYNHRIALYGMGGVGKTQTALAYAHARKTYYTSIFWISGVNQAALLSGFQQIALKTDCGFGIDESNTFKIAERVLNWLQRQTTWLLIVDNVDDVSLLKGLLPSRDCKGHTLITTRNPNTIGIPAQGLEVDVLDINAGVDLFILHLEGHLSSPETRPEVENIVKELGCLPLAIEQSAAFIRETTKSVHEFLPVYRKSMSTRQKLYKWVPDGNRSYQYTVATTWQMSFNLIKGDLECPAAATLLQLLAFLNPDVILIDFLEAGSEGLDQCLRELIRDEIELDIALRLLQRFSLIKRIQHGKGIWMHRLVQETVQHSMKAEELQKWGEMVAELCLNAFPGEINELTRLVCRRYEEQVSVPLLKSPNQYARRNLSPSSGL